MQEARGNLWNVPAHVPRVITTNGETDKSGLAIMGAGIALEAKERYPELPKLLGDGLKSEGNRVFLFFTPEGNPIFTFPTKIRWREKSSLPLIKKSTLELVKIMNGYPEWKKCVLPRPGCGNGGLTWTEVKAIIQPILDDRFIVVTL